jgi:hypothetical protein
MKIFLDNRSDRNGDIITLEVESSDTLADLKAKIREKIGIRPDQQLVVLTGKDSEDGWALVDCNIQNESTLYLITRIIGLDKWVYISSGHGGESTNCSMFFSSNENFVNTLIAFRQTVHSFLFCTFDEH